LVADEEREEQRRLEVLKLYFEFYKHFTTLSAAGGVALVAIYRGGLVSQKMPQQLVALSLLLFGLAASISAFRMAKVLQRLGEDEAVVRTDNIMVAVVTSLVVAGAVAFMAVATGWYGTTPWLLRSVIIVLSVIIFVWFVVWTVSTFLRFRHRQRQRSER
jgi:small-conductance mechanosensitive channel